MTIRLDPNIEDPDRFYAEIVRRNEGLSPDESLDFALRLVFLLANQIGRNDVLLSCIEEAAQQRRAGDRP